MAKRTSRKQTGTHRRKTRTTARKKTARRGTKTNTGRRKKTPHATVKGVIASAVAAVEKRLPGASPAMDAIMLLETDHRRLEELLKRGEETTDRARKERREVLATITAELGTHELIEEKLLYPALKQHPEARDIVLEGFEEHHVADLIVKELHDVATDDEQWGAKFKVLKENIEHHIQEEEGPMFRTARGVMTREELQALGAKMAKMKAST